MRWLVLSLIGSLFIAALEFAVWIDRGWGSALLFSGCWLAIAGFDIAAIVKHRRSRVIYVVGDPFDTETNPRRRQQNAARRTGGDY